MLFDQNAPLTASAMPPSYFQGDPTKLKFLGFNPDGTRNTWGKIMGWHPVFSMGSNMLAKNEFQSQRATDALANQQQWAERDKNKSMFTVNTGLAVGGALSGNPQLTMQGITGMGRGIGSLTNPVPIQTSSPRVSYLNPYNI